jgi:hypothetical protein
MGNDRHYADALKYGGQRAVNNDECNYRSFSHSLYADDQRYVDARNARPERDTSVEVQVNVAMAWRHDNVIPTTEQRMLDALARTVADELMERRRDIEYWRDQFAVVLSELRALEQSSKSTIFDSRTSMENWRNLYYQERSRANLMADLFYTLQRRMFGTGVDVEEPQVVMDHLYVFIDQLVTADVDRLDGELWQKAARFTGRDPDTGNLVQESPAHEEIDGESKGDGAQEQGSPVEASRSAGQEIPVQREVQRGRGSAPKS